MAKSREKKIIAILVIIIVILLGIFGTLTFLLWDKNKEIKDEIAKLSGKKNLFHKVEDTVKQQKKELDGLEDFILRASQILPPQESALTRGFLKLYGKFVKEGGVESQGLTALGAAQEEGEFTRYRYRAEVRGTFSDIVKFFNAIESHERFFKIDNFEIRNKQLGAGVWPEAEKHCNVTISTYTFKER